MSQMIYKHGGDTLVWGISAQVKIIEPDELEVHLEDGWFDHPSYLFKSAAEPEPEPEPEPEQRPKRGRKPKADTDDTDETEY